jgi:Tol biopolymer transport system component
MNLNGKVLQTWGNQRESWFWPIESYDGKQIAYRVIDDDHNSEIFKMNVDGTNRVNITYGMCRSSGVVSWSPDNSRILLNCQQGSKKKPRIFILNSDGTNAKSITPFFEGRLEAQSWRNK